MTRNFTFLLYFACLVLAIAYPVRQQQESVITYPALNRTITGDEQPLIEQEERKNHNGIATSAIDDVIQLPEEPETQGYVPTSIKDFEAADPTTGISLISIPTANSLGNAVLSFNMNLPEGRHGMDPMLSIVYVNEVGSTWMGTGWNLSAPSISIDVRWGVPRYDAGMESEMYLLNGEQLAPVNNRAEFVTRTAEKVFYKRVENEFNKIIRHGDAPGNYWWEVKEKTGVRHFYGGKPGTGVIDSAVLKDDDGNIANWALVETRDLKNNFVRYVYTTVSDPGISASTIAGRQLYLSQVLYTGHGTTDGPYKLDFIRDRTLGEDKRKDVFIDGRLGFKMVSADLLRKVAISFNADTIRTYEFTYAEGAFYKTILKKIKELDNTGAVFYSQEFDYFDEVRNNNSVTDYKSKDTLLDWSVQRDGIKGDILNPIPQFEDDASVINTAKVTSKSGGVVVTVGTVSGGVWSKKVSVGGGFTYGKDDMEEITSLIDINGDGLPDKVFKDGTSLYYRANLGVATRSFGEKKLITGVSDFGTSETENIGGGGQVIPYSGFLGYNHISSTTTSKVYFADFNGDGLIDVANGGMVYFNHLDPQGNPMFTTDSKDTPSPIFAGNLDPAFRQKDTARQSRQERDFPLQDIVRFWEAPVNGTITITAPVQLVDVPNTTGVVNNRKDGVRVSIQRAGVVLWNERINAGDFAVKIPTNVTGLTVTKGQRIYFRVQSIYNGEDDVVKWDPIVRYTTAVTPESDVHRKTSNYYRASEDFILHNKGATGMGKQGSIAIDGYFKKQVTSDSVFLRVTHKRNTTVTTFFEKGYSGNEVADEPVVVPGQFAVDTGDEVYFTLLSRSYIDRSAMQWIPHYAYVSFTDSTPVTTANGSPTIHYNIIPDNSNFNNRVRAAAPVNVTQQDTVKLWPRVTGGGNGGYGSLWFTIKGNDTVYARRRIYVNGGAMNTAIDTIRLIRKTGEPLFLEYATDSMEFAGPVAASVQVYKDSSYVDSTGTVKDTTVLKGTLAANLYANPAQDYMGSLFRGWGSFSLKGDKGDGPILENMLNLNELTNSPSDPNAFDTSSLTNIPDPSRSDFVPLFSSLEKQYWRGYDSSVYVMDSTMSSSRLYLHDVFVDTLSAGAGAIYKVSGTLTDSYSLGVSVSGVGPSGGRSDANTVVKSDMMDFNGDRYPDVINDNMLLSAKIQYTMPHGGLGTTVIDQPVFATSSFGKQEGLGMGGEYEQAFTKNKPNRAAGGAANTAKASMGVSGSVNWNEDYTASTWMDINGDGLVDRVMHNGQVMLNMGYKFGPAEQWNFGGIDASKSLSYGGGLGVNIDGGSFEGGFGISRTEGRNNVYLNDINGDGLPDQMIRRDDDITIRFNTGAGFGDELSWKGFDDIASVYSVGESYNLAFTITIPIYIVFLKICINPNGTFGHGTSRQQKAFMDLDGDGYADYVQSNNDGQLSASASPIGRTNMLRSVKGPLGASFMMDYERVGNTYDMPQSKWVLKEITIADGAAGDGIDTMRRQFIYEGGRQDRHEREFYGFSKVITRELNTADNNKVYRSQVQEFHNTSFYNKGLLASEWIEDSAGHKYTQTINTYDVGFLQPVGDSTVRFAALTQVKKIYYEGTSSGDVQTVVGYQYDNLGNVIKINDAGDGNQQDMTFTSISYHDNDNLYIKSIPQTIEVTTAEGVKRKRSTAINSSGGITRIQQFLADGTAANTDIEYDDYGNITKLTNPANYKNQRMSYTIEYDNVVHSYPVKVTDAFGYINTSEYDYRFGMVTRTISRNDEPTEFLLDNRGRVINFKGPYEISGNDSHTIAIEYHHDAIIPYAITRHYDPEHKEDINVYNFTDGLGRSIQLKKQVSLFKGKGVADDVKMVVSGTDLFDAFGRITASYTPVLEIKDSTKNATLNGDGAKLIVTNTYDALDRTVKRVSGDGSATSIAYSINNGMVCRMVTDALGNRKETLTDVRGRKRFLKVHAPDGIVTTRYDYNALNEMVKVTDARGTTITAVYDNMGRKTSVRHPNAGLTEFEFDLAGNLIKKISAEVRREIPQGGGIQYQYDYDRLTDIDYPRQYQNKVKYTYGAPGSGVKAGRVTLQQDASGGQEFFYSMQGQIVKTIRTVLISPQFSTTYVTETEYDSWNRVKKMVYPDGEEIMYHYNKSGGLDSMDGAKRGNHYRFVTQIGYDEYDQRVYMGYSNGTDNYYSYDTLKRRLTHLRALSPAGSPMLNNSYSYDPVGNIAGFINDVQAQNGFAKQTFHYDNLYRMDSASGEYSGSSTTTGYGLKFSYDNLDNITRKIMYGAGGSGYDHTYLYTNSPYQAMQIGENNYEYDSSGNQRGYGDIENFYDEENRLMGVVNKGVLSQFTYDAEDNRVVKSTGGMQSLWLNGAPAGAVQHAANYTVYVNPYVSATSATFTKHYYIDGQRVASKLGHGIFTNISFPQSGLTAGGVDYTKRVALMEQNRNDYYASLGISPGPPTDKNFWARPENSGIPAPVFVDSTASNVPNGWPGNTQNPPNGPPVFVDTIPSRDSVHAGYGFQESGHIYEGNIFFYHFDNAGSTTYVTNFQGNVAQHTEYMPSGEVFFSEHSGSFTTPYLFTGTAFDEETGYYNYRSRYYDPILSQWLTIPDPTGESFLGNGPGGYSVTGFTDDEDEENMIANPIVSKIAYSGSTSTESSWVGKQMTSNDGKKLSKSASKAMNSKPRRKILGNRYANLRNELNFNNDRWAKNSANEQFRDDFDNTPDVNFNYELDYEPSEFEYDMDGNRRTSRSRSSISVSLISASRSSGMSMSRQSGNSLSVKPGLQRRNSLSMSSVAPGISRVSSVSTVRIFGIERLRNNSNVRRSISQSVSRSFTKR